MTRELLLSDANLSDIVFSGDGGTLSLTFLNMSDGREIWTLQCNGLLSLKYDLWSVALPLYVGEVMHSNYIGGAAVVDLLDQLRYGFVYDPSHIPEIGPEGLHHFHIEGGAVIDIACTDFKLRNPD